MCGRRPVSMSLRQATQARHADGWLVACRMCSYVQPVRPEAVPRRRRVSTAVSWLFDMQRCEMSEVSMSGRVLKG
jgi:hypothetical protein